MAPRITLTSVALSGYGRAVRFGALISGALVAMAVAFPPGTFASLAPSGSSGGFVLSPATVNLDALAAPTVIGDADGDGDPEVALRLARVGGRAEIDIPISRTSGRSSSNLDRVGKLRVIGPAGSFLTVADAGDLDRDGFDDVWVGAPGEAGGGAVYLVRGGRTSRTVHLPEGAPRLSISGGDQFNNFGAQIAGGRDVTGDGIPDLAAGAQGGSVVLVISGRRSMSSRVITAGDPEVRAFSAPESSDIRIALVADLDGDRSAEVAVGQPGLGDIGAVTVFYGGAQMPRTAVAGQPGPGASVLRGFQSIIADGARDRGSEFGAALVSDRDGALIVGAPGTLDGRGAIYRYTTLERGADRRPPAPIILGKTARPGPAVDPSRPLGRGSRAGETLVVGDVDDDGRDDVLGTVDLRARRVSVVAPVLSTVQFRAPSDAIGTWTIDKPESVAPSGIGWATRAKPVYQRSELGALRILSARASSSTIRATARCLRTTGACYGTARQGLNGKTTRYRIAAGKQQSVTIKRAGRSQAAVRFATRWTSSSSSKHTTTIRRLVP